MTARALLIVNPASRGGARLLRPSLEAFVAAGVPVEVAATDAPGHAADIARARGAAHEFLFVLGGDGTVTEVLSAAAGTDRTVGIIPGGTGNLLARALGIPVNVRRAVPALLNGRVRRIDLGVLGDGRIFAVAAGTGVDSEMLVGAPLAARRHYGVLAYVASATSALLHRAPFTVRAEVDGRVIERDDCVLALIANVGVVLNGLLHLGPAIRFDDGLLDVCVYSSRGIVDDVIVAARLARRDFAADRRMAFARGASVTIDTTPVRAAEADGELMGQTPLRARVSPGAVPLLVPRFGD